MPSLLFVPDGKRPLVYHLQRLWPDVSIAAEAWRLTKLGTTESYDVLLTETGWRCECPHWVARCEERGEFCKHLTELAKCGYLGEVPV